MGGGERLKNRFTADMVTALNVFLNQSFFIDPSRI